MRVQDWRTMIPAGNVAPHKSFEPATNRDAPVLVRGSFSSPSWSLLERTARCHRQVTARAHAHIPWPVRSHREVLKEDRTRFVPEGELGPCRVVDGAASLGQPEERVAEDQAGLYDRVSRALRRAFLKYDSLSAIIASFSKRDADYWH